MPVVDGADCGKNGPGRSVTEHDFPGPGQECRPELLHIGMIENRDHGTAGADVRGERDRSGASSAAGFPSWDRYARRPSLDHGAESGGEARAGHIDHDDGSGGGGVPRDPFGCR